MTITNDQLYEEEHIDYHQLVPEALRRGVIKEALKRGPFPDENHFYITFQTEWPGVMLSQQQREKFPTLMTIVIQNLYDDLKCDDEKLSVTLYFNNRPERLVIPLASILKFNDPYAEFELQFEPTPVAEMPKPQVVEKKQDNVVYLKPRGKK